MPIDIRVGLTDQQAQKVVEGLKVRRGGARGPGLGSLWCTRAPRGAVPRHWFALVHAGGHGPRARSLPRCAQVTGDKADAVKQIRAVYDMFVKADCTMVEVGARRVCGQF